MDNVESDIRSVTDNLIGDALGVGFLKLDAPSESSPLLAGTKYFLLFLLFFCLPIWLSGPTNSPILWLSIWGALYFSWATYTAKITTMVIYSTIDEINLLLSQEQKDFVCVRLESQFSRGRVFFISLAVGCFAVLAMLVVLHYSSINYSHTQIFLFLIEFAILIITGAQAANVGKFYGVFAEAVKVYPDKLFVLAPSRSPLIDAVNVLGKTVMLFWLGIFVSICTLFVFITDEQLKLFIFTVVLVSGFFSFCYGSIIFLRAQRNLGEAARRVAYKIELRIIRETNYILDVNGPLDEKSVTILHSLYGLHVEVARYAKSPFSIFTIVSIITPLLSLIAPLHSLSVVLTTGSDN